MIWNAGAISQILRDTRGGNAHKNSAIRGGRQTHDEIRAAAVAAAAQTVDEKTADGTAD